MNGFAELVDWLLRQNGLGEASIYVRTKRELPGFFRPTKDWDMLVVHEGHLIAAVEFKSQRGPSFGNNFNNRNRGGHRERHRPLDGVSRRRLRQGSARPGWAGSCCLKTATGRRGRWRWRATLQRVPEFRGASYCRRYELLLRKLVHEKLYG